MTFLKRFKDDSATTQLKPTGTIQGQKVGQDVAILGTGTFGEMVTVKPESVIKGSAVYNLLSANFRQFSSGGSVSISNSLIVLSSGTSLGNYGTVQSFRSINHKDGSGALVRFSGLFSQGVAGHWQGAGAITVTSEYSFGFNGADFGIWHRYNGALEVQTLTITGAAAGAENATVTLDGVDYTVPLTAGTTAKNANEVATYLQANATGWDATQNGSMVVISATSDGNKTNAFTFLSSTATGTFSETTTGVTKTSSFIDQSDWSEGVFEGFDPTKGNEYQIRWQNGFGCVYFYIADPDSGVPMLVHILKWSNNNTSPSVQNPSMRLGAYSTNTGGTGAVTVSISYFAGFIEGSRASTRNPRSLSNTKSISTTETNILTIRNRRIYNGVVNQAEIEPRYLTLANDGSKSAIFTLRGNATIAGTTNYSDVANNLISEYDTSGTTVTGGGLLATFAVAKGQSIEINLRELEIRVPPTLVFTISGYMASGAAADLTAALSWLEDV